VAEGDVALASRFALWSRPRGSDAGPASAQSFCKRAAGWQPTKSLSSLHQLAPTRGLGAPYRSPSSASPAGAPTSPTCRSCLTSPGARVRPLFTALRGDITSLGSWTPAGGRGGAARACPRLQPARTRACSGRGPLRLRWLGRDGAASPPATHTQIILPTRSRVRHGYLVRSERPARTSRRPTPDSVPWRCTIMPTLRSHY
jgi:hypothetical protein